VGGVACEEDSRHARRSRRVGCWLTGTFAVLALGACGASARTAASTPVTAAAATTTAGAAVVPLSPGEPACGAASGEVAARADELVAHRIYALELASPEVGSDRRQIAGYQPLLSALAAGNRAGVQEAVTSLVYSHTHVVRLLVKSAHPPGSVLADVGGPYIIAPVSGTLRLGGRTIGSYVFSVQDDLGYVKLESRYVGLPLILRQGSRRISLEGSLPQSAAGLPASGPVSYQGTAYEAISFDAKAFPASTLRVTLLVPAPSARAGCLALHVAELGRIGQRIWGRFNAVGAPPSAFVTAIRGLNGALAYVRAGGHRLAGATTRGPARIPASGTIVYRGRTYAVDSFASHVGGTTVRVYQLIVP
jgi:hypothetical protein